MKSCVKLGGDLVYQTPALDRIELLIGDEDWDADGTDGNVAYIYWFWLQAELYGPLRVELYSDQAADDGVAAPYEYRYKEW